MFKLFEKTYFETAMPEKRPNGDFVNPDIFLIFEPQPRFVIWEEVLDELAERWKQHLTLWMTWMDFGEDEDDYENQFQDYHTIELVALPVVDVNDPANDADDLPLVQGLDGKVYINGLFIQALKAAGAENVWYDTTAPYGRY